MITSVKPLKIIGIAAGLIAGSLVGSAEARGWHHGDYHPGYSHHYRGGHGYHKYHHRRHHRHSRHHRYRRSNEAAYLAGGLVLGSLFTHAYYKHNPYHDSYRDAYYGSYYEKRHLSHAQRTYRRHAQPKAEVTRRLFKDRNGNCFERLPGAEGEDILVPLDAASCNW